MRKVQLLLLTLLLVVLLFSCAPAAAPAPQAPSPAPAPAPLPAAAPAPAKSIAPAKPAWEIEWDKTLAAAKKEGTVVVLASPGPIVRNTVARAFKSTYGLTLEFLAGSPTEVASKIVAERRAGIHSADAGIMGFSAPFGILKPAGALERLEQALILPELTEPQEIQKVWRFGLEWVDKDHTMLTFAPYVSTPMAINTQLMKPGEVKGYRDLLNPKWKGKIVIFDPTLGTGIGTTWAQAVGPGLMGWDYMRKLMEQEPILTRDARLQIEWVARGKYAVAIAPRPEMIKEFAEVGAPVQAVLPEEGTYTTPGPNVILLLKDTPHPNAAKLFVNWLLSKEGQTAYCQAYGVASGRMDVSIENVDPLTVPDPKKKYVRTGTEEELLSRDETVKMVREIFGPVKK